MSKSKKDLTLEELEQLYKKASEQEDKIVYKNKLGDKVIIVDDLVVMIDKE